MGTLFLNICIDTEGPLRESLGATFKRMRDLFGVTLEPSAKNLKHIQDQTSDLIPADIAPKLAEVFSYKRLDYANTWTIVKDRMETALSQDFRMKCCDDLGIPLLYNFYITDFTGFRSNPREKPTALHEIYDFYNEYFWKKSKVTDGKYWHYHHVPQSGAAHEWGRCLSTSGEYDLIMSRNLLDRDFFPSVFRAGGHVEREDLSYWLECWFPFDYSNRSFPDQKLNPWGDWSRASHSWEPYHPCFYDVQKSGQMKRTLFRVLEINTWEYQLTDAEIEKAFREASVRPTVLSLYTHDYRDVAGEVSTAMNRIRDVGQKYLEVTLQHGRSLEIAQSILQIQPQTPKFTIHFESPILSVQTEKEIWGTQPFLAFKTFDGEYFHDNFLKTHQKGEYVYHFSKPKDIEMIGVACTDPSGQTSIQKWMPTV